MSKFTEGKWKINEYCDVLAENNQLIALINKPRNKKEAQANARLIAAAPEMYQLLDNLVWYIEANQKLQKDCYDDEISAYVTRTKELLARIDGEVDDD